MKNARTCCFASSMTSIARVSNLLFCSIISRSRTRGESLAASAGNRPGFCRTCTRWSDLIYEYWYDISKYIKVSFCWVKLRMMSSTPLHERLLNPRSSFFKVVLNRNSQAKALAPKGPIQLYMSQVEYLQARSHSHRSTHQYRVFVFQFAAHHGTFD